MPKKHFDDQLDDEEVLHVFHKHPIVMRKGLVFGMLGPLVGALPTLIRPELGFGWFFGGLAAGIVLGYLIFLPWWVRWHFTVIILTDKRFVQIQQKGFFNRSVSDLSLNLLQSINYRIEGIEQSLFGFGTITLQTYMGEVELHDMYQPARVVRTFQEVLRDNHIVPAGYDPRQKIEGYETEDSEAENSK